MAGGLSLGGLLTAKAYANLGGWNTTCATVPGFPGTPVTPLRAGRIAKRRSFAELPASFEADLEATGRGNAPYEIRPQRATSPVGIDDSLTKRCSDPSRHSARRFAVL